MKKCVIRFDENSEYYLSTQYEKAAEMVLGYGGVWTKDKADFKIFNNKSLAKEEIKLMQRWGCGRHSIIELC